MVHSSSVIPTVDDDSDGEGESETDLWLEPPGLRQVRGLLGEDWNLQPMQYGRYSIKCLSKYDSPTKYLVGTY